ncbi:ElaB/YqjD/DUF883 family membrane-anchored ribosome-binding protein [Paraburkholderia sp. GAS33]|uniref:CsbD family protein n=1 Tax=Paraburkholderia sp. GAS33 TaxID=3035130 RepID=UPI003D1E8201
METTNGEKTLQEEAESVKEATVDLLGDATAQTAEKAKELTGKAQQLYSDFAAILRESMVERPFSALAIAAGVGFILGTLHATGRRQPEYRRELD